MSSKTAVGAAIVGLALVLKASSLSAHHAFAAEFDANSPVKFKGTVSKMLWVNPHSWIYVDVKKPGGKVETWAVEGGTPSVLFRRGLTKESLKPGTEVIVDGYRAKDGSLRANGRSVTLADGQKLFVGSAGYRCAVRTRAETSWQDPLVSRLLKRDSLKALEDKAHERHRKPCV